MKIVANEETNLLVLFPSSKNFEIDDSDFSIPSFDDERFDNDLMEIDESLTFNSLEDFMNRNKSVENKEANSESRINNTLKEISEAKKRISFYLEEIENILP